MAQLRIDGIAISCNDGIITFDDPRRDSPLQIRQSDFPLILDVLDSLELDRRRAFRIPALYLAERLHATVEYGGISHQVVVININVGGMFAECIENSTPTLSVDDEVSIALQLDDTRATLVGTVRRCAPPCYGMSFLPPTGRENIESLKKIVDQVEKNWIGRRILGTQHERCSPKTDDAHGSPQDDTVSIIPVGGTE